MTSDELMLRTVLVALVVVVGLCVWKVVAS